MLSDNKTGPTLDDWFDEIDVDSTLADEPAAPEKNAEAAAVEAFAAVASVGNVVAPLDAAAGDAIIAVEQQPTEPSDVAVAVNRQYRPGTSLELLREVVAWRSRATARWVSDHRGGVAVSAAAAVIGSALVAAIVVVLSAATSVGDQAPGDIAAIASTTDPVAHPSWCVAGTRGTTVTNNSAGSTSSGPEAVLAFEAAYYRGDVGAARAMIAPTSAAAPEDSLRQAVAALPKNVSHCVAITPAPDKRLSADPNTFHVAITERDPNGSRRTWEQLVTTTNLGSPQKPTWRITQIAPVATQEVPR